MVGSLPNETLPEIIQGILGPQSVGVMAGVPNAGKTFLGLDLAAHVAANRPWFGRKVTGGPVLYVASEAPGSVKIRARVLVKEKFAETPSLPLYIVTLYPAGSVMRSSTWPNALQAAGRTAEQGDSSREWRDRALRW